MFGAPPATTGRLARSLASIAGDAAWYEEATKRLLAAGGGEAEAVSLYVELVRIAIRARGRRGRGARRCGSSGATPRGAWLARVLEAFASPRRDRAAASERARRHRGARGDRDRSRALARPVARGRACALMRRATPPPPERVCASWPIATRPIPSSRRILRTSTAPPRTTAPRRAWRPTPPPPRATPSSPPRSVSRPASSAGAKAIASPRVEEMEAAAAGAPEAAKMALAWASWGVEPDSLDARRRALENAEEAAAATGASSPSSASPWRWAARIPRRPLASLIDLDESPEELHRHSPAPSLGSCGPAGQATRRRYGAQRRASPRAAPGRELLAAVERVRLAREAGGSGGAGAARRVTGSRPAEAFPRPSSGSRPPRRWGNRARSAPRGSPSPTRCRARRAKRCSRARRCSSARIDPETPTAFVAGDSMRSRLANLELAPPGCDPRRRAAALQEIDGVLGDDAAIDATVALRLVAARVAAKIDARAGRVREGDASAAPSDLAAWEGLRACAERTGDTALRVRAAPSSEPDAEATPAPPRSGRRPPSCRSSSATRTPASTRSRPASRATRAARVAFDKLFRRVRARKDNEKLLGAHRAPPRSHRRPDRDPEALLGAGARSPRGRRSGRRAQGARARDDARSRITSARWRCSARSTSAAGTSRRRPRRSRASRRLEAAPAKNRVTAGIAAVDLYENKLGNFDMRARGAALAAPGEALEPARARAARARRGPNRVVEGGDRDPPGADARAARGRRPHRSRAARDGDPSRPARQPARRARRPS